MDPFPGHELFPNRDNAVMQTETAQPELMSTEQRSAEIERLQGIANEAQERLNQLRAENDAAENGPSRAASGNRESNGLRITKKVVGWGLGVGVTLLAGVFVYSRLNGAAADAVAEALPG